MNIDLVEGWTGPVDVQLYADGAPPNLTGCTVALALADKDGVAVSSPGTVTVTSATGGQVSYAPAAANTLLASKSPYAVRWKVTDGGSKDVFFPNAEPDTFTVRKP